MRRSILLRSTPAAGCPPLISTRKAAVTPNVFIARSSLLTLTPARYVSLRRRGRGPRPARASSGDGSPLEGSGDPKGHAHQGDKARDDEARKQPELAQVVAGETVVAPRQGAGEHDAQVCDHYPEHDHRQSAHGRPSVVRSPLPSSLHLPVVLFYAPWRLVLPQRLKRAGRGADRGVAGRGLGEGRDS